jgi:hypothetical protein
MRCVVQAVMEIFAAKELQSWELAALRVQRHSAWLVAVLLLSSQIALQAKRNKSPKNLQLRAVMRQRWM